jgi:hypothetical protein
MYLLTMMSDFGELQWKDLIAVRRFDPGTCCLYTAIEMVEMGLVSDKKAKSHNKRSERPAAVPDAERSCGECPVWSRLWRRRRGGGREQRRRLPSLHVGNLPCPPRPRISSPTSMHTKEMDRNTPPKFGANHDVSIYTARGWH